MVQRYEVRFTEEAEEMLAGIKDRRILGKLLDLAASLEKEPEARGKALVRDLLGFRSLRAIGQRYRIVYMVDDSELKVVVVGVGLRKEGDRNDIYETLRRVVSVLKTSLVATVKPAAKTKNKPTGKKKN